MDIIKKFSFWQDKSVLTHIVALLFVAAGYLFPAYAEVLQSIGYFALSGSVTNWLAIYMLFERIPFLYGSGVIPSRFQEFKWEIKHLVMSQFFTKENIDKLIKDEEERSSRLFNLEPLIALIDYDKLFQGLIDTIMKSSFKTVAKLFGGAAAFESLRTPFIERTQKTILDITSTDSFKTALANSIDANSLGKEIIKNVEVIVDQRLNELTPDMVKHLVQQMIKNHLGWLVVWGGVFGGLIGFVAALF